MKNGQDDLCQLLYDCGQGYRGEQFISETYWRSQNFKTISFNLPAGKIKNLRIDPATSSESYQIRQIKIEVGNQSETYIGGEILDHFKLFNLTQADSATTGYLALKQINSPDGQLIGLDQIDKKFILVDHEAKKSALLFIILTYLTIVSIIIFAEKKVAAITQTLIMDFHGKISYVIL